LYTMKPKYEIEIEIDNRVPRELLRAARRSDRSNQRGRRVVSAGKSRNPCKWDRHRFNGGPPDFAQKIIKFGSSDKISDRRFQGPSA
jgi:hypothetical protein